MTVKVLESIVHQMDDIHEQLNELLADNALDVKQRRRYLRMYAKAADVQETAYQAIEAQF